MVDDDLDFVRVKPQNQVPIVNFWTAMEPYFRPLTEDDRAYLLEKHDNDRKMYEIPPLGKYYHDAWAEEERVSLGDDVSNRRSRYPASVTDEYSTSTLRDTAGNTLLERLMSSLVPESFDMNDMSADDNDDDDDDDSPMSTDDEDKVITEVEVVNTDHITEDPDTTGLEERLKRELQYIGLLDDEDDEDDEMDWHAREDDEISAHLRRLGRELEEQIKVNEFRKGRLLQVVDTQLQYDQYRQLLDVLDVQVEQSYLKRFRVQKAKKRKSGSAPKAALSEHTIQAMDKRTKCVTHFGAIFKDKNLVLPTKSIYDEDSI
ncbi:histone acetyltransferases subunit 3-domain-containing protein [Fennellomyces sp. T-0311]|nr:histone acetyltransferases subunit 3-domain-containing protein [Fennellomyces sp. T-0311]